MGGFMGIIVGLVGKIVSGLSPVFRGWLSDVLDKAEEKAKTTDSPFDDMFVDLAKALLGLG